MPIKEPRWRTAAAYFDRAWLIVPRESYRTAVNSVHGMIERLGSHPITTFGTRRDGYFWRFTEYRAKKAQPQLRGQSRRPRPQCQTDNRLTVSDGKRRSIQIPIAFQHFLKFLVNRVNLRYRADLTAGSLKVAESRVIADLLLKQADAAAWKAALRDDNVLQARSPRTADRLAILIRKRLKTMAPDLWKMVRNGNSTVATHACLAAAVKHSALLADFLELVVKEQYRIFAEKLTYGMWDDFVADCQSRDAELPDWSESTIKRLRSSVFQILQQAGYIESTKSLRLQTVHIADEVVRYLKSHDEDHVLRCIEVAP